MSVQEAAEDTRLLDPQQEAVLIDWIAKGAASGTPLDHCAVRSYASELAGRRAGKRWTERFMRRHPELVLAKPIKLDPSRTKNFNEAVTADFFEKYKKLDDQYGGIPPEHIYNYDEKGIQLGGGRKNSGCIYFYMHSQRSRYHISSDNLELVTVTEAVSAAGCAVPASFILSEGPLPDLRKLNEGSISR